MTQMEADALLAEHRAVMAALMKNCISQPTEAEYEAQLNLVREEMSCPVTTKQSSSSSAPSQSA